MERIDPQMATDELTTLSEFLEFHRATILLKASGLTHAQLNHAAPPSTLTLASLIKHLAYVEDAWIQDSFLGKQMPEPWASAPFELDRDWDLRSAVNDEHQQLVDLYVAAAERTRQAVASAASLDQLAVNRHSKTNQEINLRWILVHLIEETARHAGHADLIRESVDGTVGE